MFIYMEQHLFVVSYLKLFGTCFKIVLVFKVNATWCQIADVVTVYYYTGGT